MNRPDEHEAYEELAAGHALHALEPADEQVFREHLASCPRCQASVDLHVETLGHLAYAADPFELPPGILAGIRRETGHVESAAPVVDLAAARTRRRPSVQATRWIGMAAALALVLSLGGWNLALHRDRSQAEHRARQLAAAVAVLGTDGKSHVQLTDPSGRTVAYAVVRSDDTVTLVAAGLRPNDRGTSTYVLWQKGPYGVRAMGAFDVTTGDPAVIGSMPLSRDVNGLDGFAVTREPGRRAPATPGSPPVAYGAVTT